MRYTPFDSIERVFDQLQHDMYELRENLAGSMPSFEGLPFATAFDLAEHDDEFVLTVDMPGFERDEIDLRFHDGMLWLTAEHETADETSARRRSFHEQVSIPREVEVDGITASYHNGVLEVHLPVVEGAVEHGHRIDVE